jgi:hypothetical protein
MKIILNQKEYKLYFKYSLEPCAYTERKFFRKNGEKFHSVKTVTGKERVITCFVTKDNKIFATGNSRCFYKDKFVKEEGRQKAIKNLSFGDFQTWSDVIEVLKLSILTQYNNRKK